jgi:endonuclease G, mitochondrial
MVVIVNELSESAKKVMQVNMVSSKNQIERSIAAIRQGRPLDAEDELDRKMARAQALLPGLSLEIIERVVNYDQSVLGSIPEDKRPVVDSLWGKDENRDYLDVAYLEVAQAAASSVGRIINKDAVSAEGTGFMISDSLLLTNYHIVDDPLTAKNMQVEFNYELNAFGYPKPVERFELNPEKFFLCSEAEQQRVMESLDFCIVAVAASPQQLSKYGFCPLSKAGDKHAKGDFATIIQHPKGTFKQVALRENRIVARLNNPPVLHYVSDTEHGSSGAPVFDDQWRVIGLHHGQCQSVEVYPGGAQVPSWIKEAARVSGIINYVQSYMEVHYDQFSDEQHALINSAFNCGFSGPSLINRAKQEFLIKA